MKIEDTILDFYFYIIVDNRTYMKTILSFISESSIDDIEKYLRDEKIDIDNALSVLKKHFRKERLDFDKFEEFFKLHGLDELNWGRNNTCIKQFVHTFNENDNLDTLKALVENNGAVSINKIEDSGNIFNYCAGGHDGIGDWTDEAKTIASWTNSKSSAAGPCEVLLKFMLKEGFTGKVGDVSIRPDENSDSNKADDLEIKAATISNKGTESGGHAAGQQGHIRNSWAIYAYIHKNLFNDKLPDRGADKLAYFRNSDGFKEFNNKLVELDLVKEPDKILKEIIFAVAYQYNFIDENGKNDGENSSVADPDYETLFTQVQNKVMIGNNGIETKEEDFINVLGCIQLYFYSLIEKFDYLFCCLIDKRDKNSSDKNGQYVLFRNCQEKENTPFLNFKNVLSYLRFGKLESPVKSQGRTGKIFFKKPDKQNKKN